ncbi:ABC-2 family transporter protein [Rubripirellula obstinata]|uniref:ABC-2 family transporter protein n=1 Tax=Rubripirellula obstinata TaxID=406547 RepID=A0A5B1CPB8_9BACT|nr:ABC transporter permease [Rubripirellula obstinata]KAA1262396.1 ABC-2 family transporter protein [Rubripirellula obstinata]
MTWTVLQVQFQRLMHNRVELLLTFVVPIAFFSIFALIFGGGIGSGTTPRIKVVAVDLVGSDASTQVMTGLRKSAGLRFVRDREDEKAEQSKPLDPESAQQLVRKGIATMAIVLKTESDATSETSLHADLLSDSSDQVASQVVVAIVAREIMMAEAEAQEKEFNVFSKPADAADADSSSGTGDVSTTEAETADLAAGEPVTLIDVIGEGKSNPVVSMYAAGIAVMFLLFGATGGGGAFLEERENRTLDRLLSTQMSMDQLLLGKWFYITIIGIVQVTVMFVWAQVVFKVNLVGHLDGFLMMTIVTSCAAAAFGLFLATLCKTRGQLNGLSVILILTMSAMGGSMVPRYVMSERLQQMGLWTFNAWALDGYNKIFWRDLPPASLAPQLVVLMTSALCFLVAARLLALRWEAN